MRLDQILVCLCPLIAALYLAPALLVANLDLVLEMRDDLVSSGAGPYEASAVRRRDPLRRVDLHVDLVHSAAARGILREPMTHTVTPSKNCHLPKVDA